MMRKIMALTVLASLTLTVLPTLAETTPSDRTETQAGTEFNFHGVKFGMTATEAVKQFGNFQAQRIRTRNRAGIESEFPDKTIYLSSDNSFQLYPQDSQDRISEGRDIVELGGEVTGRNARVLLYLTPQSHQVFKVSVAYFPDQEPQFKNLAEVYEGVKSLLTSKYGPPTKSLEEMPDKREEKYRTGKFASPLSNRDMMDYVADGSAHYISVWVFPKHKMMATISPDRRVQVVYESDELVNAFQKQQSSEL